MNTKNNDEKIRNKRFLEEHPEIKSSKPARTKSSMLVYPYNLIYDMTRIFKNTSDNNEIESSFEWAYNWANKANGSDLEDKVKGIDYAMYNLLTQTQAGVVFKHCKEYMSFTEIAKICGRSYERISQIYYTAASKIWRCRYVQYGYDNYIKREAERAKAEQDALSINKSNANMFAFKNNESIKMLNLSTMAYNTLRRGGINTIGTLKYLSVNDLMQLRNMGKKTAKEICDKMEKCCGWYMIETPEERNTYIMNRAYFDTLDYLRDKSDEEVINTPVGIYEHQVCNDINWFIAKYVNYVKYNISYTYIDLAYFLSDYAGNKVYIGPNNTLVQFLTFVKEITDKGKNDIYYSFKYSYNNPLRLAGAIEEGRHICSSGAKFIGFYRAVRDVFALRNIKIGNSELRSNITNTADDDILNNKAEYIDAVIRQIECYHKKESSILNQLNGEIEECKKCLNRIDTVYKALEDVRSDIKRNEEMLHKALQQ